MAPKVQKSKEAKAKAAAAGGKSKKKKWNKGKVREKINNAVLYNKAAYDKLLKEIPKSKLITPATVSEKLKITGSAARMGIRHLYEKGLIKPVGVQHRNLPLYTRADAEIAVETKPVETK
eukprot:Platyproteum_vivax@DN2658_c0_g1_i1.p1